MLGTSSSPSPLRAEAGRGFAGQVEPALGRLHGFLAETCVPRARDSIAGGRPMRPRPAPGQAQFREFFLLGTCLGCHG